MITGRFSAQKNGSPLPRLSCCFSTYDNRSLFRTEKWFAPACIVIRLFSYEGFTVKNHKPPVAMQPGVLLYGRSFFTFWSPFFAVKCKKYLKTGDKCAILYQSGFVKTQTVRIYDNVSVSPKRKMHPVGPEGGFGWFFLICPGFFFGWGKTMPFFALLPPAGALRVNSPGKIPFGTT